MLNTPQYIVRSGVCNKPVDYVWRGTTDYNRESKALGTKLRAISLRGSLACATGMCQWGQSRLQHLSEFNAAQQMIEAAWAANVDPMYCDIPEVAEFQEQKGPVNGVLRTLKVLLEDLIRSYDTPSGKNVDGITVNIYFLARHIMPDKKPFDAWLKAVLERMTALYPRSPDAPFGQPIPHEALDPSRDFQPEEAGPLLAEFLSTLKPADNPYLRTPKAMLKAGFKGVPYHL